MHIELSRKLLLDTLSRAVLAAEAKSTHPYYSTVLLDARDEPDGLRLASTTGFIELDTTITCSVRAPGAAALNARQLQSLTAAMSEGPVRLKLNPENKDVIYTGPGKRRYTLASMDAAGFPAIVEPAVTAPRVEIASKSLVSILERVEHAIDTGTGRPNLNGIELVSEDGRLAGAATCGSVLAVARSAYTGPEIKLFLPTMLHRSLRALCERSEMLQLSRDERWIFVESDDTLLGSLLPHEGFPDWRRVVDTVRGTARPQCRVDAPQLAQTIRAVTAARTSLDQKVSLRLSNGEMLVSMSGAVNGEDTFAVDGDGEFAFTADPDRLMDTLKGVAGIATLSLESSNQPCVVTSEDGYEAVVMPILT